MESRMEFQELGTRERSPGEGMGKDHERRFQTSRSSGGWGKKVWAFIDVLQEWGGRVPPPPFFRIGDADTCGNGVYGVG